jgi:hypothetical protein
MAVKGRRHWVVKGAAFLVLAIAFVAVLSFVVMSLWNMLIPSLFGGPTVRYLQAVGLLVLSRILFGGFRGRGGPHGRWRQRMWQERWERMTPEERARLREKFPRCGWGPANEATEEPKP